MNKVKSLFIWIGLVPVVLALASSGCATKRYVAAQIEAVNGKVSALDVKTDAQADKERTDISRVEEKLGSTDAKVAEVASAAQKANASAAQANQLAQQDRTEIAAEQSEITANRAAVAANAASIAILDKAISYSLVAKLSVTFDFDKSNLGDTDQAALEALVQQVQSTPRAVFELLGFTDPVGTTDYNLALSRRRADEVARYLVHHGIPLQGIHIIGLGKEPVPSDLLANLEAVDPDATESDAMRLARRVVIRIYAPNASVQISSLQ
jgi:outer membrane protein OmpA-like peptidoglycan-associated protein